jgi:histidinol-phosphate aminotransferase
MFRSGLDKLPTYCVGEEPLWQVKLDANERSAPLPPAVRNAIAQRLRAVETHRYPEMTAQTLRQMLAEGYGLNLEQVNVGNGSSELIAAVCAAFGGPGRPIAYQWPSFSMYPIYAALADSPSVAIPLDAQYRLSVDLVVQTVRESGAKLLLLCNPNNPTGVAIPVADLRRILQQVDCPVLVDEAYQEYCGESCVSWLQEFPRLMVARTFSKAYGLAAARTGYLLASAEMSAAIGKFLLPYHLNAFSLAAAEVCFSLRDQVMMEVQRTVKRRDQLASRLRRLKFAQVYPSSTNFLLVKVAAPDVLHEIFINQGIGVRNFSRTPGLSGCLRITLGTASENELILSCVKRYGDKLMQEGAN